ncbi:MAG: hypothetical protein KC619_21650 [Myxococcales bacterium]|nr:hypothetical protein [Myxococcales bacterium]
MSRSYADRSITLHERIAHVSIERFARSPRCPDDHRFHARSSLQLVVSWLAVFAEHDSRGVPWHRLSPDGFVSAALDCDASPKGRRFLADVLDVMTPFYSFLAEQGVVRRDEAMPIQRRLVELSLAFS